MIARQFQSLSQIRSDRAHVNPNLPAVHVALGPELVVNVLRHIAGNGKTQSFAATGLGEDEGVDADHTSVDVDQRAAAVARIDGRVGLNVGGRVLVAHLPRRRTYHTHGHGVFQALRTAKGKYDLSLLEVVRVREL